MAGPISTADILFPESSSNFSDTLASLKRSTLSVTNRLRSILEDATFVEQVAAAYGLPLIANERCGSWYIPPDRKVESAYFKSTDGHMGQWSFSMRRLNTQVLDAVGKYNGCIIVDSTRRGKSMPDALSKTVPIWCTVFNRVLFPDQTEFHDLSTPQQSVSASEHSQIEGRIARFVEELKALNPSLPSLRSKVSKPLRPFWVVRGSSLPESPPDFEDCHPIVLCTASRRVSGGEISEGGYIQGAGDDSESWAHGLTPPIFWQHKDTLLQTSEEDLPELIASLLSGSKGSTAPQPILVNPTTWLHVGTTDYIRDDPLAPETYSAIILCDETAPELIAKKLQNRFLHLKCSSGKLGSRDLRKALPQLIPFLYKLQPSSEAKLLICCPTGKDLSLGVALATLCLVSDAAGTFTTTALTSPQHHPIDKAFIRQRLNWITLSYPTANPSRATLQSVNAFLMSSERTSSSTAALQAADAGPAPAAESQHLTQQRETDGCATASKTKAEQLFESLIGTWSISRQITSFLATHPSGSLTGSAAFTGTKTAHETLYAETGTFNTSNGLQLTARRQYIYRYSPATDGITVYFAPENGYDENSPKDAGLFLELDVDWNDDAGVKGKLIGKSRETHLCGSDLYDARYWFEFDAGESGAGVHVTRWQLEYTAKGPKKNYVSLTQYERV